MPSSAVTFLPFAKEVHFRVVDALVVYEPSVFGGDGSETRVNITLRCDDASVAAIQALEGDYDSAMLSAVKDAGIRAKLDKNTVRIYDANRNETEAPAVWRGARVNAMLTARGTWKSRTGSGLSLICTDLQFMPVKMEECPF